MTQKWSLLDHHGDKKCPCPGGIGLRWVAVNIILYSLPSDYFKGPKVPKTANFTHPWSHFDF